MMPSDQTVAVCGVCGRPMAVQVFVGSSAYHPECVRGPSAPMSVTFTAPPWSTEDVRQLARETAVRFLRDVVDQISDDVLRESLEDAIVRAIMNQKQS